MMTLQEALHVITDKVPWSEESHVLDVHAAIDHHFAPEPTPQEVRSDETSVDPASPFGAAE